MRSLLSSSVFTVALLAISGCGGGPEIVPFTGQVLYKGQPLPYGSVMFQPVDGGQASSGTIGPDGTFEMKTAGVGKGAAVGVNRVRITCFPAQDPNATVDQSQELALGSSLIPTRYNSFGSSGLTVEVMRDGNEPCVFELDDDPAG